MDAREPQTCFKQGDRVLVGRRKATVIREVPIGYVAIHFDSAHGKWSTVEKLERVRRLDEVDRKARPQDEPRSSA